MNDTTYDLTLHNQWCYSVIPPNETPKEVQERGRKRPLRVSDGSNASSDNPDTWNGYEGAVAAANRHEGGLHGFVFSKRDRFCGLDFDNKANDPAIEAKIKRACAILYRKGHYIERSRSGVGRHAFFKWPDGVPIPPSRKRGWFEFYSHQYIIVTEDTARGCDIRRIREDDGTIARWYEHMFGPTTDHTPYRAPSMPQTKDDREIVEALFVHSTRGGQYQSLYYQEQGDDDTRRSEKRR